MQKTNGFSLIELMVAVTIMVILGGIAGFAYRNFTKTARMRSTQMTLKNLENAIDLFHNDTGSYPTNLTELSSKPADPKVAKGWQGPYLKKEVVSDSYGTDLVYQVTRGGKHPYELYSWGPNKEGSPEDEHIVVWDL